jgi:hypothetical protein
MRGHRETTLTAGVARAYAVGPAGGMAVASAARGMPVAVRVQVRVMESNCLLKRKATPSNDHSFPFALSLPAQWQHTAL